MSSNRSKALLRCGMLAGPFYLAVALIQVRFREGFDIARHPLSVLARRTGRLDPDRELRDHRPDGASPRPLDSGARWRGSRASLTWFLAGFGLCMIVAAIFPSDPMDGFPPGTPEGPPTSISTTGLVHFASGALGFACLAISCFIAARTMWRRRAPSFALAVASERPRRRARILRRHGVPVGDLGNLVRRGRGLGMARHHVGPAELGDAGLSPPRFPIRLPLHLERRTL